MTRARTLVTALVLFVAVIVLASCQAVTPDDAPDDVAGSAETIEPGGARLWQENCMRCHALREPAERSDAEWEVALHHMRVRANLTAPEHRLILRFLKTAN